MIWLAITSLLLLTAAIFTPAHELVANLLARFLRYNPIDRVTAMDSLTDPYFESVMPSTDLKPPTSWLLKQVKAWNTISESDPTGW